MALQEMIEQIGYTVIGNVLTGQEAVSKALQLSPDLILMDIKLKGKIDGIEAARKIRRSIDVPVIFLTAFGDKETVNRAKQSEPSAYIIKPFNELALRSNIEVALHQQKLKKGIVETKKHLEEIINNISDMLICFDNDNRLILFNSAAETITGYSQKELYHCLIHELPFLQNQSHLKQLVEDIRKNNMVPSSNSLHIRSKSGKDKTIAISSTSPIKNIEDDSIEVVLLGREVPAAYQKVNDLSKGHSYILFEENKESFFGILRYLNEFRYNCLIISRILTDMVEKKISSSKIKKCYLSNEHIENECCISDLDGLSDTILKFCKDNKKPLILLDRLDYFIVKFSFEEVMLKVYEITDTIRKHGAVLILHIIPGILDDKQLMILENELSELPAYNLEKITIETDSYNILKLLHNEKQRKHIVNYKMLKDELFLSYPTINRKINDLQRSDLVRVFRQGRTKIIEITLKGETLLKQ